MTPELKQSYAECCRIARRSASSFYPAFWWLSREKFRAMCALYAFLRQTDDLSDSAAPLEERRQQLAAWRESLTAALAGNSASPSPRSTLRGSWPALIDTINRYHIPHEYFISAVDGAEMDLVKTTYASFAELERYCYCVAGVVGLSCIHIWGYRDRAAFEPAMACGTAFQLTNVLRDITEDAGRGRIYLPQEDLARFGYSEAQLQGRVASENFQSLLEFELARADSYYAEAARLQEYLEPDGQRVYALMWNRYQALLEKIRQTGSDVLRGGVRLTWGDKISIVATTLVGRRLRPTPARSSVTAPPLARSQRLAE